MVVHWTPIVKWTQVLHIVHSTDWGLLLYFSINIKLYYYYIFDTYQLLLYIQGHKLTYTRMFNLLQ